MKNVLACFLCVCALPASAQSVDTVNTDLPPTGFGSLRQTDITILLRAGNLRIGLLPMDERVIRLLAPDTYRSLRGIRVAHEQKIRDASPFRTGDQIQAILVTIYASRERTQFDPERVMITSNNRYFRAMDIIPITPRWSEHQLEGRETASALYLFDNGLDPLKPMVVEYGTAVDASWEQTLRRLESERVRVEARARGT